MRDELLKTDLQVGENLLPILDGIIPEAIGRDLSQVVLLWDERVAKRFPQVRETFEDYDVLFLDMVGREHSKTISMWDGLTDEMLDAGVERDAVFVALGGGVTTDLGGFVASTYLRGLDLVNVPTTLMGAVDAAVGGKNGVSTRHGKNLIGTVYHPRLVVVDLNTLDSLTMEQIAHGMAEAVKYAAISSPADFEWMIASGDQALRKDHSFLGSVIDRANRVKMHVVARDAHDWGERQILNFGHTIGHALERALHYRMPHGDAVAVGMVAEARLGAAMDITRPDTADALVLALSAYGLPTRFDPSWIDGVVEALSHDKKRRNREVRLALLGEIGFPARDESGAWTHVLDIGLVDKVLG